VKHNYTVTPGQRIGEGNVPIEQQVPQQTPEVTYTDRIDLDAPSERELCSTGAVKLTHIHMGELKISNKQLLTDLEAERQRNNALAARASSCETELRVFKAFNSSTGYKEIIIRTLELVIVVLLTYAIDFERAGNTQSF
jgi:hypothetical protein